MLTKVKGLHIKHALCTCANIHELFVTFRIQGNTVSRKRNNNRSHAAATKI